LVPTKKTLRNAPGSILEGVGIVHDVLVRHDDFEVALDFHIFDVYDFDILIGHPVEKLFLEAPLLGTIDLSWEEKHSRSRFIGRRILPLNFFPSQSWLKK